MFKKLFLIIVFGFCTGIQAQQINSSIISKKIAFINDTIKLENSSISDRFFELLDANNYKIDSTYYIINFAKAYLIFNENYQNKKDSITIKYQKYPDYLTQEYTIYDSKRLVNNDSGTANLYKVQSDAPAKTALFDGLETSGSITRGITVGNNQNSVVNSNLDLQITGKLSDKLSIKGSIQDSNLPLRNGGYSQKLQEFDQIFIELKADKWNIRAGDLFLENRKSKFLNFNKKVQGLLANVDFDQPENKTNVFASAAIVRGLYAKSNFVGQEGNQGPYKLRGQNGELYIIVIPESENVFVNGILLQRGENNDYIIDYNAGEIKFTSLFAITSEMRIVIEYQYTDQNYARFVAYAGATHQAKKWSVSSYLYSENDLKDQSLQQNLSEKQAEILKNAGDNTNLMNSQSAFLDSYSTNKILYKKVEILGLTYFEFSNVATDILYNVKFSLVGNNAGSYVLFNNNAIGKIYKYIAPISGVLQGNYEPIVKLVAPTKIQIASFLTKYNPSEKTNFDLELGISNNDKNLFSLLDDNDNKGLAGKLNFKQRLLSRKWTIDAFGNYQFIQKTFTTIERLFTIEFNRDWNLTTFSGNQSYLISGLNFELPNAGKLTYQLENLTFSENFNGNRQQINGLFNFKNVNLQNKASFMKSDGKFSATRFIRSQTQAKINFNKNWVGGNLRLEDNIERLKSNNLLSNLSQRFLEYGAFVGRGDSTKVFVELGYLNRINDSLQNNFLRRVNKSNSFYLKSKLIKTEKSELSLFINYRTLNFENSLTKNLNSLNSKLLYNDRFFKDLVQSTTSFETVSGTIAQQEFTYLEVAPTLGVYTWNDYNGNGVQELQEFEIAPFKDQAKYVRVFLPNQIFIKTHQNRFSQNLTLNPSTWQNDKGFKKLMSYFYNQTTYLIERKIKRNSDNFDLNPFKNSDDLLGLSANFKNSLFFNRGKQNHSLAYTYLNNRSKNLLSVGALENKNVANELQYLHLLQKKWLFDLDLKKVAINTKSENYASRNFEINSYIIKPKLSYLFNENTNVDVFYVYQNKKNTIGDLESLQHTEFGTSFSFSNEKKFIANGEFSFIKNNFVGDELSPVAFQMLEGLQSGQNMTWRLLLQKNLTQYLELNINYQGRKSGQNQAIHTGNIQLKAIF